MLEGMEPLFLQLSLCGLGVAGLVVRCLGGGVEVQRRLFVLHCLRLHIPVPSARRVSCTS